MIRDQRLYKLISFLFNESQDGAAGHQKLIVKCQQIYKETETDLFFETFTIVMQRLMITMQRNPNVDRTVDFIAKFAASISAPKQKLSDSKASDQTLSESNADNTLMEHDQTSSELGNQFLTSLMKYLIEVSRANCDAVRYRSCQLLSKLMSVMSNDQSIDEDLFDLLCDSTLERLKDINSRVQVQAISAIYRLQDPNDRDCRVIKALTFLMTFDPHWQVRFQALANIAFSKQTLPEIIDRVRDPHPQVRRKSLLILSEKVLIKFISIEKRLFILNYSLKDEDHSVVETCCKKLLPSWLAFKENDLCKLLKALDVVDSTDTCELMLNKMYSHHSLETLCNDFSPLLNEKHVIPLEKLDAESVFYWYWICAKCKSLTDKSSKDTKNGINVSFEEGGLVDPNLSQQIDGQDHLDSLLPSLTEYCEFVEEALTKLESDRLEKSNDERYQIENSFVVKQLINMFRFIDFSDVHGKKNLTSLCHKLFSNKNYIFLFDTIMKVYKILFPNLQQRINNLVELISDLKDPNQGSAQTQAQNSTQNKDQMETSTTNLDLDKSDLNQSVLSPQQIQLKISELKFQRFKLKDDFDNMYKEFKNVDKQIDMNRLAELRAQIKECEDEITGLQSQLTGVSGQPQTATESVPIQPVVEAEVEQESEQVSDPIDIAYHCLQLAVCLLEDVELKSLTPQIRSLCDILILPNISSVNEELRALSVLALGLVCILKLEMAQKYVPLFLEVIQRDKKEIVAEAFKAMINCILAFSVGKLVNSPNLSQSINVTQQSDISSAAEATSKILSVMTSLLDNNEADVYTRAVEGFCKLYMTGHIVSAKLFSKLLIMYYSPLTENDVKLRAFLSSFLPQFAFFRPANQLCVEESVILTLKCLINAPTDSYLCEIDLIKVMETLFNLANPKNLIQRKTQNTNMCHENIVKSICYEILKDDNAYKFKTYLKVLQMADLTDADYLSLKNIHELAEEILDHIEDKLIKKSAKKFADNVYELLSKKPEHKDEQDRTKLSSTSKDDITQSMDQTGSVTESNTTENEPLADKSHELIDYEFPKIMKKTNGRLLLNKNEKSNDESKIANQTKSIISPDESQNTSQVNKTNKSNLNKPQTSSQSRITIEKINPTKQKNNAQEKEGVKGNRYDLKDLRVVLNKLDTDENRSVRMSKTLDNSNTIIKDEEEEEEEEEESNAETQEDDTQSGSDDDDETRNEKHEIEKKTKKFKKSVNVTSSLKRSGNRRSAASNKSQNANQSDTNSQEYEPPVKVARATRSNTQVGARSSFKSLISPVRASLRSQSARNDLEANASKTQAKTLSNKLRVNTRANSKSSTRQSPRNKK